MSTGEQTLVPDLWRLADLVTPMMVRLAATYQLADHIAAGRNTATAIAEAAGLHSVTLERMLRHLVTIGLLTRDNDNNTYDLTELGTALRHDHPALESGLLDMNSAIGRADLSFIELEHTLRTGQPAYPVRYGLSFWNDLATNRALGESFDRQMANNTATDADEIIKAYDWSEVRHVLDLGGGDGVLLSALLKAHPRLRGTVLDLPRTAERARDVLRRNGLTDRADIHGGSFFDPLPTGPDVYLLCQVVHNWDDESAIAILKRCAEAAGRHGRVLIIEETGSDGHAPNTSMDVRMLAYFGGRERNLAENIALGQAAGLTMMGAYQAPGMVSSGRSIIEFRAGVD